VAGTSLLDLSDKDGVQYLDLAQPPETWPQLPPCRAAVLCAAITSLETCRRAPEATRLVNVTRTLELAQRLAGQGAFLVFISSNLVFDGSKPWRDAAEAPCPVTEYGRQKAEAEAGLARFGNRSAIVRLTKVFHAGLPLMRNWMTALEQGQCVKPFSDLLCSPITLPATIQAIARVAENQRSGIWQLSGSRDISYAGIARHLAARRRFDPALVQPISALSSGPVEFLPACTTLDATRAKNELGFAILEPEAALDHTFFHERSPV
jgi:dTDP-4-dehydrorhamnose reductase